MALRFIYFRQYFSVRLSHEIFPGEVCDAFTLQPDAKTERLLLDKKMRYKAEPGKITVYYSGDADPANVPPINNDKMVPYPGIDNGTEFMFLIDIENKDIIKKTLVPSPTTDPLFDVKKTEEAIPWYYIKKPIFTTLFNNSVSTKMFASFIIKDSKNNTVLTSDTKKNDQGNFQCSADMSQFSPGFYSIELGTGKESFYLDSHSEMTGKYGFIRLVKDNTWSNPKKIYDANEYNVFDYEFQKATYAIAMTT